MADTSTSALALGLLKDIGPTVTVVVGLLVFRRQERVKRLEEHSAVIRKAQFDALREVVEAVGCYHRAKTWRRTEEQWRAKIPNDQAQAALAEDAVANEAAALRSLADLLAHKQFVLGGEIGRAMMAAAYDLGKAKTHGDQEAAHARLERTVARWIPPLEEARPAQGGRVGTTITPWAMGILWVAFLWSIFSR